jgi:hypothetical protein
MALHVTPDIKLVSAGQAVDCLQSYDQAAHVMASVKSPQLILQEGRCAGTCCHRQKFNMATEQMTCLPSSYHAMLSGAHSLT